MTEFEALVARVMSNAFMGEPTPPTSIKPIKAPKKHRLVKKVESMSEDQRQLLMLLLSEQLAMITVKGEMYAYRKSPGGWLIRSLHDGEPEHTVFTDFSACSCQDSRFRGRICKHMSALKEVLT